MIKPILRSIIPSQNTLFELAQDKPDNSRWTLTFPEDEVNDRDRDDLIIVFSLEEYS